MVEALIEDGSSNRQVKTLDDLLSRIRAYFPQAGLKIIERAYYFSEKAHEGQIRRSGEPYISHPLSVAGILADLQLALS